MSSDDLWRLPDEVARPPAPAPQDHSDSKRRRRVVIAIAGGVVLAVALTIGLGGQDGPPAGAGTAPEGTIQLDGDTGQGFAPAGGIDEDSSPRTTATPGPTSVPSRQPAADTPGTDATPADAGPTSGSSRPVRTSPRPSTPPANKRADTASAVPDGPRVDLVRYIYFPYGNSQPSVYERMQTTGQQPGGSGDPWRREDRLAGVYTRPVAGSVAFTECRWSTGFDYFLSLSASCDGHVVLRTGGYVLTQAGPGRLALYLCVRGVDHFVSTADNCLSEYPGHSVRTGVLGYGVI